MAFIPLDYGAREGGELFSNAIFYEDGERIWAARSDWFVRFYGYVYSGIAQGTSVNPGTGRHLFYFDSGSSKLTRRTGDTHYPYITEEETKRYIYLLS